MAGGASDPQIEHLLRRAGFGARSDELALYGGMSVPQAIDTLLNYQSIPDDVDSKIQQPGYVGITTTGPFSPDTNINDARQRWLFRMVHTNRPLQEKMTLFWHNHFATGYTKIAGAATATDATRYMAAKASEDPGQVQGQIEMLRDNALGNFRDILVNIAQDTAMLYWLDGRTNTKALPQENFAREVMELFTMGVGHYTEPDVYAGARVFTGWNLRQAGSATDGSLHAEFYYNAAQHDTSAKTFSFPIYRNGSPTIPARSASDGMQDGLDLLNALASNPNTGPYLAKKLYAFFVTEAADPDPSVVQSLANTYYQSQFDIKAVLQNLLTSAAFWDPSSYFSRYSWPAEFVVRALKDIGWRGASVNDALGPLTSMGQTLFEPPNVAGWELGQSWFSSGAMLARMNYASSLAGNQRFNLATAGQPFATTPDAFLSYYLGQLLTPPLDSSVTTQLRGYLTATNAWPGTAAQLQTKAAGLVHLIAGLPEYQLV